MIRRGSPTVTCMIWRNQKIELRREEGAEEGEESAKNGSRATSIPSCMSCITNIPFNMLGTSESESAEKRGE